jgi:hypothetical protein
MNMIELFRTEQYPTDASYEEAEIALYAASQALSVFANVIALIFGDHSYTNDFKTIETLQRHYSDLSTSSSAAEK